jgi:phage gp46-like protein
VRRNETLLLANQYALESWAWMIEDRVVSSIDLTVTASSNGLIFAGEAHRPDRDSVSFRFAHTWDHLEEDT